MNQNISQIKPTAPVMINVAFQPQYALIKGTLSGAIMAPIPAPELNMAVAKARSFLGNHSATVLMAAGKFPASLTPSALRATPKPNTVFVNAWHIAATLQRPVASAYPILVPSL